MSLKKTWAIIAICLCSVNLAHSQEAGDLAPPMPVNPDAPAPGLVDGDAGGYDKNGCDICCDACCGPQITFRLSAIFWERANADGDVLISEQATGAAVLDADDFDFDWEAGVDASVIYDLGCGRQSEIRGLWLNEQNASVDYAFPAATDIFINTTPVTTFAGNDGGVTDFESDLYSIEWNMRQQYCGVTYLYGVRYVSLEEEFRALLLNGGNELNRWTTDNDLLGVQAGGERSFCMGGWNVTFTGKAGIYWNDQETSFRLDRTVDGTIDVDADDNEDELAFIAELGVNSSYALSCNSSIVFGYQVMWLDQVAVATDQVGATGNFNAVGTIPSTIDSDGDVFYHGANIGIEVLR